MINYLFVFMLLTSSTLVAAAEDYDTIPQDFFRDIAEQRYSEAIDGLVAKEGIAPTTDATQLKNTFIASVTPLGAYRFNELVEKKALGSRYVVLYYIVGMDKKPITVRINLYKPNEVWVVKSFNFDTDVDKLAQNVSPR